MGTVTYPNEGVSKFVELNFVPVQVQITNKEMTDKYSVSWTPTILVLDAEGKEHYRSVGFVPPDEFVARFTVRKVRFHLGTDEVALARAESEETVERCRHRNVLPEAIYWQGVATYKHTHDPKMLREAYDTLKEKYPQSDWAQRAEPYKAIEA